MILATKFNSMTARTVIHSHWIGFLLLLPFLIMLAVHDALGLSDAFFPALSTLLVGIGGLAGLRSAHHRSDTDK